MGWGEALAVGAGAEAGGGFEAFGEVALVVEAAVEGDGAEGLGGVGEEVAGGLEAELGEVGAGGHVEDAAEFALELADGKTGLAGELADAEGFGEVLAGELEGGEEAAVFFGGGAGAFVGSHETGDAGDFLVGVVEGEFAADIPKGGALGVGDEPDLMEEGEAGVDDVEVFGDVALGEGWGVEVVVGAAEDFGFGGAALHAPFGFVGEDEAVVEVFGEDEDVGEEVEEGEGLLEVAAQGMGAEGRGRDHAVNLPIFGRVLQE